VPADVVTALGLLEGQLLSGEVISRLDTAAEEEGAVRSALRSLELRAHGAVELARKLERKGHGKASVSAALARLDRLGLLDDRVFA
jgi:SOS response regulatory protein OraA/RecX